MNDNDSIGAITSLLPLAIWSLIAVIPSISLCRRTGKTRWWAAVAIIPFIGPLILLFVFAYSRWVVTPTLNVEVRLRRGRLMFSNVQRCAFRIRPLRCANPHLMVS